jgi:hypothetical protein
MDGIMNLVIKLSKLNNTRQARCLYQMDNILNSITTKDMKKWNFGLNKVRIGWNLLK